MRRAARTVLATALLGSLLYAGSSEPQEPPAPSLEPLRQLLKDARYAEAERQARERLRETETGTGHESLDAATVIDVLVESLWRNGKAGDPEAARLAERAIRIKETRLGADDPEVARSVANLAELLRQKGDQTGALPLYERALSIRKRALGGRHIDVARSLSDLANLLSDMARYTEARALYEEALGIQREAWGEDDPRLAQGVNNLGILFRRMGDYAAARPLYQEALDLRRKSLGPDHPDVARSLTGLAILIEELGEYEEARPLLEEAVDIWRRRFGSDHVQVATGEHNLAILHRFLGNFATARTLHERSLTLRRKLLGEEHPEVAQSLSAMAGLLEETGDFAEARDLLTRALAIRRKTLGESHPLTCATLHELGFVTGRLGDREAAKRLHEEGLKGRENSLPENHPDIAHSLWRLGMALRDTGDLAGAQALIEKALGIYRAALGPDHPYVAITLGALSEVVAQAGDRKRALDLAEEALSLGVASLGSDHLFVAETLGHLAELRLDRGDTKDAFRDAARAEEISLSHLRPTVRTLPERQALGFAAVRPSGLDLMLSVAAGSRDPELLRRTWDLSARSRALVLDEVASRHKAVADAEDSETARLAGRLTAARGRLARLMLNTSSSLTPAARRTLLEEARRNREAAERALAERSVSFRREQLRERIGFREIAAAMPRETALVAYRVFNRRRPGGTGAVGGNRADMIVFVLAPGSTLPALVDLGPAREIDRLVARWREEVLAGRPSEARNPEQSEAACRNAGEALRRAVWDPLRPHLGDARRVLAVPDGSLNQVNLAALPGDAADYLVESGPTIHYLTAETDVAAMGDPRRDGEGLLVLGGPDFGAAASLAAPETRGPFRGQPLACPEFREHAFEPLPGAAQEAREIADLWAARAGGVRGRSSSKRPEPVVRLIGPEASEAALKKLVRGRRVVHLATHGFFLGAICAPAGEQERGIGILSPDRVSSVGSGPARNPLLLSGLALSGANRRNQAGPDEEDGVLTAEEIAALDLSAAEWVVLSACDTAGGEVEAGEGVFGLRRAFQIAGASSLVMSLWPVQDRPARLWMTALYEGRLSRGLDTAEAVRQASLAVLTHRRERGESTHPFFWAAFISAGDWR